jgi:polyisoprenoid-binding protein YceI
VSVPAVPTDGNVHTLQATGKLTVAGVTKTMTLTVNCKWNAADKSMVVNGVKSFKMTEYSVKPPTALFGTIKTGDQISIDFYVKVTK